MRAVPTRKLDKRITRVWRLSAAINVIFWSLLCMAPTLIFQVIDSAPGAEGADSLFGLTVANTVLGIVAVVAFIVFVVIVPKIRWIQWSFEVYDQEIDIHKGIFWKKRIIIPLIRVQNVDTKQGPILRANGLASFTVATAAGPHEIPGLKVEEADSLRDRVAVLARIAQEDV